MVTRNRAPSARSTVAPSISAWRFGCSAAGSTAVDSNQASLRWWARRTKALTERSPWAPPLANRAARAAATTSALTCSGPTSPLVSGERPPRSRKSRSSPDSRPRWRPPHMPSARPLGALVFEAGTECEPSAAGTTDRPTRVAPPGRGFESTAPLRPGPGPHLDHLDAECLRLTDPRSWLWPATSPRTTAAVIPGPASWAPGQAERYTSGAGRSPWEHQRVPPRELREAGAPRSEDHLGVRPEHAPPRHAGAPRRARPGRRRCAAVRRPQAELPMPGGRGVQVGELGRARAPDFCDPGCTRIRNSTLSGAE